MIKTVYKAPNRTLSRVRKLLLGRELQGEWGPFHFAQGWRLVNRTQILVHLALTRGVRSYLEIGVRNRADNLDRIPVEHRIGVDPDPESEADFRMTSDAFFATESARRFDMIFIDGLHTGDQVRKDIENALAALNPGGMLLLHDLNPPTAFHARETYEIDGCQPSWCGDSWRGFVHYRAARRDLEMFVIDADFGVGFIRAGLQSPYEGPHENYADLERDRKTMLNLISVRDFLRRYPRRPRAWSPIDRALS